MDRNTKRNIGASPIANFIREKITQLRLDKGLSEYKLSLDLGHNKSYIQNISLGRGLPSMSEFIYMCDYFDIAPKDFFDEDIKNPINVQKAIDGIKALNDKDLEALILLIYRLNNAQKM